ncbi:hypothetical protein FOCC_FOCC013296 [Frankliniella occidentalis]|nr:hypothetical protein FOCC_FOCC013296 [Frankliniella occidentalis]
MHEISGKWKKPTARSRQATHLQHARAKVAENKEEERAKSRPATACTTTATRQTDPESDHPVGRTSEKLGKFKITEVNKTTDEYILMHSKSLQQLASFFKCDLCRTPLTTTITERKGSAAKVIMSCPDCSEIFSETFTSARVAEEESSRPPFEINRKLVDAFVSTGNGHAAMQRFGAVVGLNIMDSRSYANHLRKVTLSAEVLSKEVLQKSRDIVRNHYIEMDPSLADQEVIDIDVSFDGSWHRRGFSSLYGIAAVIDIATGLIVDYVVLSKFCHMCSLTATDLGEDTPEYKEWYEGHIQSGECNINYEGSSGGMEVEAAVILAGRSVEKAKFRYLHILGDGDAKSISAINKAKPYGEGVEVKKEECVNHINKRLGNALREAVKKSTARGEKLGGRGDNTLTQAKMLKLQRYYTKAIIENAGDVKQMQKAIKATLYHCSSTDQKPMHQFCSEGKNSWCFYKKGLAEKKKKKDLKHANMGTKLSQNVFKALLPIYERVSSTELLERCKRLATSNANEAFHSVVWKKCPKMTFISKSRLDIGMAQAVAEFNMGFSATESLKAVVTHGTLADISETIATRMDRKRKAKSKIQSSVETKIKRAKRKTAKRGKQSREEKETGDVYVPGGGD